MASVRMQLAAQTVCYLLIGFVLGGAVSEAAEARAQVRMLLGMEVSQLTEIKIAKLEP